jgi:2-hydroxy fatty acid dioxygenase
MSDYFTRGYCFYHSYHKDETNKAIHVLCVWPILLTFLYLLCLNTDEVMYTPTALVDYGIEFDWGCVVAIVYIVFYLVIEQPGVVGITAAAMVAAGLYYSNALVNTGANYWREATIMNVSCWIAQFYGHYAHEGRSPALLDNLVQAFLFAPLFVLLEIFFAIFNYKPALQALSHADGKVE